MQRCRYQRSGRNTGTMTLIVGDAVLTERSGGIDDVGGMVPVEPVDPVSTRALSSSQIRYAPTSENASRVTSASRFGSGLAAWIPTTRASLATAMRSDLRNKPGWSGEWPSVTGPEVPISLGTDCSRLPLRLPTGPYGLRSSKSPLATLGHRSVAIDSAVDGRNRTTSPVLLGQP